MEVSDFFTTLCCFDSLVHGCLFTFTLTMILLFLEQIPFDVPVKLLPHTCRALYCHSGLPDDLGIQYQSYKKTDLVAADDHIEIRPGLGHTGAEPFDETHGWYRAHRALSGSVSYTVQRKGWTPFEHKIFPTPLRNAVVSLLMCQNRDHNEESEPGASSQCMPPMGSNSLRNGSSSGAGRHDEGEKEEDLVLKMSSDDPTYTRPAASIAAAYGNSSSSSAGNNMRLTRAAAAQMATLTHAQLASACQGSRLSGLPKFVIYNILEFLVSSPVSFNTLVGAAIALVGPS